MTNEELKAATIFDLTSDTSVIAAVIGYLPNKQEYIAGATEESKALAMMDYAQYVEDKKLLIQLEDVFASALATFNE